MDRSMFDMLFLKTYTRGKDEPSNSDGETCEEFYKRVKNKDAPDAV